MEAFKNVRTPGCGCGCRSRVIPGGSDCAWGGNAQTEYSGPSPQMWPGWDMNPPFPFDRQEYPQTGYPQAEYPQTGINMNQGGTVWPITNCPDTSAGHLEQNYPPAMAYVPWQQWQTAYAPERGLMQGTIFPELDLQFNYGRCKG